MRATKVKLRLIGAPLLCLLLSVSVSAQQQQGAGGFYLKNGDRVVFYGDSITDQRLYTTFAESYVVTRFPRLDVAFTHSGWGGDRVTGGGGGKIDQRLERDVFPYKPTVVTIMLGMNDASYKAFDQPTFQTFSTGYESIVKKLKDTLPGVRLTLIQPSPFDDVTRPPTFEGGYNNVLIRYGQFVRELAGREKADVADLNTSVVAALQKANTSDASVAQKIVPDRVHPGPGGHLLMAAALLKAWNAPALVSAVEIDAATKSLTRFENTKVTDLKSDGGSISWTQSDNALPFPLEMKDAPLALAVSSSDVVESLDQQPLKVTNLTAANYSLRIDGEEITSLSKEQLQTGVNLALIRTPMLKQALEVHDLTLKHNNIHFARWRTVQVPLDSMLGSTQVQNAMKALDALEAELIAQQKAKAKPTAHRFVLVPQTVKSY
jgi:lysophospholipase L1-like esterase